MPMNQAATLRRLAATVALLLSIPGTAAAEPNFSFDTTRHQAGQAAEVGGAGPLCDRTHARSRTER
jgi:hypothetical protein